MHIAATLLHDNRHNRKFMYLTVLRCISVTNLIVSRYPTTSHMRSYTSYYLEMFIWSFSLIFLAFINPELSGVFSICPLHHLGFEYCPGCGLGRSVSYFLHLNVAASVQTHILGIPATIIIVHRLIVLITRRTRQYHSHRTLIS